MVRQLRHHTAGGWCRITARGMGVQAVAKAVSRIAPRLETERGLKRGLAVVAQRLVA